MTDELYRLFGPAALLQGYDGLLYECKKGQTLIREITFIESGLSTTHAVLNLYNAAGEIDEIIDRNVSGTWSVLVNTARPLWVLDPGESIRGYCNPVNGPPALGTMTNVSTGTDATSFTTGSWDPAAETMYILAVANSVTSAGTLSAPSSITGTGTWTQIGHQESTVAAANNVSVSAYYWAPTTDEPVGTTTINFATSQHSCSAFITSFSRLDLGRYAIPPYTLTGTPIVQAVGAADSAAPGSTTESKAVTLAIPKAGQAFYLSARCIDSTVTPPGGFTQVNHFSIADASGNLASLDTELSVVTTPPWITAQVGPSTYGVASTVARAALAWEMIHQDSVNCMITGIEVT